METPNKRSPFELLLKIDWLYNQSKASLPEQKRVKDNIWTGIGFCLGPHHLVIDIKNIEEILADLPFTKIPVVKTWVKGVANMRGHLLPIIDLNVFLGIISNTPARQRRIMAVKNTEKNYTGLIVDTIFGMQHFYLDNISKQIPPIPAKLRPFITEVYKDDVQHINWLKFSLDSLMKDQQFLNIGF